MQLPEAYRSLPRPSSPTRTKASPVCASSLDQHWSRIKKHAQTMRVFHQKPQTSSYRLLLYEVPKTFSHKPMLSRSRDAGCRTAGSQIAVCQSGSEEVGRVDSRAPFGWHRANLLGISRKEVIQPQVPLRLPCYDFAPVTDLAFGRSFPRVRSRTSGTTGFHGVTGGVYKARERIHRGVADPRLLAIPASCSRVADCNPNLDRLFGIGSPSQVRSPLYRPL